MEKTTKDRKKNIDFSKNTLFSIRSFKEKEHLIENMAMLISSGISILETIEIIKEDVSSLRMKGMLSFIKEEIKSGSSLWMVLSKTNFFSDHTITLIRIGEESGKLSENLKIAAQEEEKNRELKSKIYTAMIYPVFVFFVGVFIGISIAWFILPRLAVTFSQFGMELPFFTKILINIGSFLGNYGIYFVPGLLLFLFCIIFFFFFFQKTKFIGQLFLFSIPAIRKIIREVEVARFGYFLGVLLDAGIPIKQAITSLSRSTEMIFYKKFYTHLQEKIEAGNSFKKSFSSYQGVSKIMPSTAQNIIFAAEKSGTLPATLIKVGERFEEKVDRSSKNLAAVLEPIMLVVVALGVAFVAVAIIMPTYGLIGGVNQRNETPTNRIVNIDSEFNDTPEEKTTRETSGLNKDEQKIRALSVDDGYLIAYKEPKKGSDVVAEIMPGEEMYFISEENEWYQIIITDNEIGWVPKKHIEMIDEDEK